MSARSTYTPFILCFALLLATFWSVTTFAQSDSLYFGIRFPDEVSAGEVSDFLEDHSEVSFHLAEVSASTNNVVFELLGQKGIQLYVRSGFQYVTTSKLERDLDLFTDSLSQMVQRFSQEGYNATALGLFSYSQTNNAVFDSLLTLIKERTADDRGPLLLYDLVSKDRSVFERSLKLFVPDDTDPSASLLVSQPFTASSLAQVDKRIQADSVLSLIIFESGWFETASQSHPPFTEAISFYQQTGEWLMPSPNDEPSDTSFNYLVLIYLLLLTSLGVHYRVVAAYPFMLFRYFTAHRFFADDIMSYRERNTASGVFLFIQHALFTGMLAAIIGYEFISPEGMDALQYHIPQFLLADSGYLSLFTLGVVFAFITQLLAILWLYLPSTSMRHFSQTLNLYTWPFHLDFVIVTGILVLHLKDGSETMILFLSSLFVLIWLLTFMLTALDSSRYMQEGRIRYMLITFGIHTFLTLAILISLLVYDPVRDLLQLAFGL